MNFKSSDIIVLLLFSLKSGNRSREKRTGDRQSQLEDER